MIWCAGMVFIGACADPDPTPVNYGVRQVALSDRSLVLDAAEAALVEHGFAIASRDPAEGVMRSDPIENDPRDRSSRPGSGISSSARTRRTAEVRVAGAADRVNVYCKILVEEQATQAYRMYAPDRSGNDLPGAQTAIDRDAATTVEQNTVWRTLRRDTAAERQILASILERTGREPNAP